MRPARAGGPACALAVRPPFDEVLEAVVGLSGRPHLTFNAKLPSGEEVHRRWWTTARQLRSVENAPATWAPTSS